jgi:uncharacterized protein (DUF1501 family)
MKSSECHHCQQAATTRRDFLRVGALSLLGITLSDYLRFSSTQALAATNPQTGKAQSVIFFWLEGGPSQVDTWDVKGNTSFKPISTNADGIQICEIFPKIAKHMDKLSIIRSMKTQQRDHPPGTIEVMTGGHVPIPSMKFPSFGSIVAKELGTQNDMPPFVVVPTPQENAFFAYHDAFKGAFIGAKYDGMILSDPSKPDFQVPDLSLPKSVSADAIEYGRGMLKIVDRYYRQKEEVAEFAKMDTFQEQALKMILSPVVKKAFDLSQESEKTKDRYGRNRPGQSVLLARRLVEAGCRFVTAAGYKANQWDTHGSNDKRLREDLGPILDQSLSALMEDLDQRGLLKTTVVIVAGEFGRTAVVNQNAGRDHWPDCWSLLLGGGGIQGGHIIGASDKDGAYVADRPVSLGGLYATVYKALGVDWTKTYTSPIGRPVYIANGFGDIVGAPLEELV